MKDGMVNTDITLQELWLNYARNTAHHIRETRSTADKDRLYQRYKRYVAQLPTRMRKELEREFGF